MRPFHIYVSIINLRDAGGSRGDRRIIFVSSGDNFVPTRNGHLISISSGDMAKVRYNMEVVGTCVYIAMSPLEMAQSKVKGHDCSGDMTNTSGNMSLKHSIVHQCSGHFGQM